MLQTRLTPFKHQTDTADFINANPGGILNLSDPGTGKTGATLLAFAAYKEAGGWGRMLVTAPKSILETAWCDDCMKFTPQLSICAAYASHREQAFNTGTDVVVTNHDAAKWLLARPELLKEFSWLVMDESTAFKNHTTQRSKAMNKICRMDHWAYRIPMTGTVYGNGGLEGLWHQVFLADLGEHLGTKLYQFLHATHEPVPVPGGPPNARDWIEKEGARDVVADLISDITVRYRFEDCTDVPEHTISTREHTLPPKLQKQFDQMLKLALLEIEDGEVEAAHAAAVGNKLLQIASGSVYDSAGDVQVLDTSRYELAAQLANERDHSVIAFHWRHQRDGLHKALLGLDIPAEEIAIIDGEGVNAKPAVRTQIVRDFQKGKYRAILVHPRSAGHGLTFTKAATTIWASPTGDAELWEQVNRRIYRTSQTRRTETIVIQARDNPIEQAVRDRLDQRVTGQVDFYAILQSLIPLQV